GAVVAIAVVGLRRAEPESPFVGDPRGPVRRLPALGREPATDHERSQGVGRPDPYLLQLLARQVHRAVRSNAVDGAHRAVPKATDVAPVDRPECGIDSLARDEVAQAG